MKLDSAKMPAIPHLLHVRPTFGVGGAEVRSVQIINYLGDSFRHTIVALDGRYEARDRIDPDIPVTFVDPPKSGNPLRMPFELARRMEALRPDLVLTYNWGAIDAVAATYLFRGAPLIHAEDGFGPDEADRQKRRRVWTRRLLLRRAYRVIAPSYALHDLMLRVWKLPSAVAEYLPNGVDIQAFRPSHRDTATSGLTVGSVGNLTAVKRQVRLIEACAAVNRIVPVRLIIAGEGPEREALVQKARSLNFLDRLELLGRRTDVQAVYARMDVFALSSESEQMSISVLEGMASSLPVVATDVGDTRRMVSPENAPYITPPGEPFVAALSALASDPALRRRLGDLNRSRAAEVYSLPAMLRRYESLYRGALGRMGAPALAIAR